MKEQIETVANERLAICSQCSFQSEVRKRLSDYKTIRPDVHCTNCGCTLAAKTRCLSCSCPIGLWKEVLTSEQEEEIKNLMANENKEGSS